ncbi:hypothetical protein GCM10010361_12930 [Streptomyces olivaceiscleroticus]|uniref:Uncharacterized protein n=1 Tax=Streptomyces olivaceiscleroticus TaxID=68245 RepID=A0ABN0ZL41_9ACTN
MRGGGGRWPDAGVPLARIDRRAAACSAGRIRRGRHHIAALVGLLNPAAVMTTDGGGMVGTALLPVEGGAWIAQYMVAIADKAPGSNSWSGRSTVCRAWWPGVPASC